MSLFNDFIGWVVACVIGLFAWVLKVTWSQEKRITALETQMQNLPKETAAEVVSALKKTD